MRKVPDINLRPTHTHTDKLIKEKKMEEAESGREGETLWDAHPRRPSWRKLLWPGGGFQKIWKPGRKKGDSGRPG